MCLRKGKIMHGIYIVTLNKKAFLGLKSGGGRGGRRRQRRERTKRLIQRKRSSKKGKSPEPTQQRSRIPVSGAPWQASVIEPSKFSSSIKSNGVFDLALEGLVKYMRQIWHISSNSSIVGKQFGVSHIPETTIWNSACGRVCPWLRWWGIILFFLDLPQSNNVAVAIWCHVYI